MAKSFAVSINHNLGADDARRRVEAGIAQFRSSLGSKLSLFEERWTANRLDFKVGFMGQVCSGKLDVLESQVHLEIVLPGMLGFLADKVRSVMTERGRVLLGRA